MFATGPLRYSLHVSGRVDSALAEDFGEVERRHDDPDGGTTLVCVFADPAGVAGLLNRLCDLGLLLVGAVLVESGPSALGHGEHAWAGSPT